MELWQIIKEIEEKDGIKDFYLHNNCDDGAYELNIEFNNDIADSMLKNANIKEIGLCAFWKWAVYMFKNNVIKCQDYYQYLMEKMNKLDNNGLLMTKTYDKYRKQLYKITQWCKQRTIKK